MTAFMLGLFEVSLTMAAAVLVLLVLSRLFGGRFTAKCRYIVWAVVVLRLCIPVGSNIVTPIFSVSLPQSVTVSPTASVVTSPVTEMAEPVVTEQVQQTPQVTLRDTVSSADEPKETVQADQGGALPSVTQADTAQNVIPEIPEENPDLNGGIIHSEKAVDTDVILKWAFAAWAVGCIGFISARVGAYRAFMRKLKRCGMLKDPDEKTGEIYSRLCCELGIKKAPRLYVSLVPISPVLCGFIRRRIIIPDLEFTSEYLIGALSHEIIHFKRGDVWMKLLCTVAQAVNWFNPFAHAAVSKCVSEMEISCDEAVLRGTSESDRLIYGRALLAIVRRSGAFRMSGLTTGMNPRRSAVKERIMYIVDMRNKRRGIAVIAAVVAMCIVGGAVVGCTFDKASPDDNTYYVPEYMKYADGDNMYELSLTYGDGVISAERTANGTVDAVYTMRFVDEKLSLIEVCSPSGELLRKNEFKYNENGDVTSFCYSDTAGTREYRKATFTYDEAGRLVEKTYTEDTHAGYIREAYAYDEDGRLLSSVWEDTYTAEYTLREYDEAGREIKKSSFEPYNPYALYNTVTEYDTDTGKRVTSKYRDEYVYYVSDDETGFDSEDIYTYDDLGNLTSEERTYASRYSERKTEYTYTEDGLFLTWIENDKAEKSKFDTETLESSGLYNEGAYIKWLECDKAEYERYLQVYLIGDVFDDDGWAAKNYLINLKDHAWFIDYDMTDTTYPYVDFVGTNAQGEAEARAEWYDRHASGIIDTAKRMIEAFLTNDADTIAEITRASDGSCESYKNIKIGNYTIGVQNLNTMGETLSLEVEILESDNEVLTPGAHNLTVYSVINTYFVSPKTYEDMEKLIAEKKSISEDERECRRYAGSLLAFDVVDIDAFKAQINDSDRELATWMSIFLMSNSGSDKYEELNDKRIEEIGYYGFTADEISEYVKEYFDTESFVPVDIEDISRYYRFDLRDGYYMPIAGVYSTKKLTFDEEREENGHTVVTVTVWADQSATVKSKTVEYHFEMVDGEPKVVKTKILEDTGFAASIGQGT